MLINHKLVRQEIPDRLRKISPPPKQLFVSNKHFDELLKRPIVAIVGSRKISPYGRLVTEKLTSELARQGVVIVSGLAIGVDACAHQAALDSSGTTVAVLPTSLDNIQPVINRKLALNIIQSGGALISEYPTKTPVNKAFFCCQKSLGNWFGRCCYNLRSRSKKWHHVYGQLCQKTKQTTVCRARQHQQPLELWAKLANKRGFG